ncbi:hypothetical protein TcYC6_0021280 [Trypanosoma cruzi]|nr:hypothetical protein TcYC6_0021280 [Trypanosoma cruzi]
MSAGSTGTRWRLECVSPGLRRGVTAPRRQFRGTVPACSRLLGGRERHASPHGPGGAEPLHVFSQRQAPAPWATVMGCDWALPWLFGVKPLAFVSIGGGGRGFKRRVAFAAHSFMGWPAFRRLPGTAPSELTADVPGGEGRTHGVLLAGCCRPWLRVWGGACASGFWILRAALLRVEV